jgi:hypothetical protein
LEFNVLQPPPRSIPGCDAQRDRDKTEPEERGIADAVEVLRGPEVSGQLSAPALGSVVKKKKKKKKDGVEDPQVSAVCPGGAAGHCPPDKRRWKCQGFDGMPLHGVVSSVVYHSARPSAAALETTRAADPMAMQTIPFNPRGSLAESARAPTALALRPNPAWAGRVLSFSAQLFLSIARTRAADSPKAGFQTSGMCK